ncbi:MAG TPA: hypothetical protein VNG33_20395, partial [Polyangiaceae bacterium]|nr:hypothetical protein [Polyangiaceae bacterium]
GIVSWARPSAQIAQRRSCSEWPRGSSYARNQYLFRRQRDSSDEHVWHADDSPGSLEVGVDSAGEARRGIIKWQDL